VTVISDLPPDIRDQLMKDLPTNIKEQLKTGLPIILRPVDTSQATISIVVKPPVVSW
jgi:cation transport regulator ChaB